MAFRIHAIDLGLHAHMRGRFDLEIATLLILIEFPGERAFDIPGTRIVALDQVAAV